MIFRNNKKDMVRSKTFVTAAAFMCLCMSGCGNSHLDFDACGQIDATEVTVSAESNGKILFLDVEEGDALVAGVCVGAIDSMQVFLQKQELYRRLDGAVARKIDIDRQLAPQISQLANLKLDRQRYVSLLAKDAGTKKQVDDIESQIAVLEGQIAAQKQTYERNNEATEAEIGTYKVQIAQKEDQLAKCRISSPVSGTVLTKYSESGEFVTSGKPVFKVADLNDVYVKAYFTTVQLSGLKLGDEVDVIPDDGTPEPKKYPGKVTWISEEAEFTPKNIQTRDERADLVYAVKVSVPNDGYLRLGMYAYVKLK